MLFSYEKSFHIYIRIKVYILNPIDAIFTSLYYVQSTEIEFDFLWNQVTETQQSPVFYSCGNFSITYIVANSLTKLAVPDCAGRSDN